MSETSIRNLSLQNRRIFHYQPCLGQQDFWHLHSIFATNPTNGIHGKKDGWRLNLPCFRLKKLSISLNSGRKNTLFIMIILYIYDILCKNIYIYINMTICCQKQLVSQCSPFFGSVSLPQKESHLSVFFLGVSRTWAYEKSGV